MRSFALQRAALHLHLVRGLPGAGHHLADTAHGLRIAGHHTDDAQVVQDVFGRDGLLPDAALGEGYILGNLRIQVMAHHQHVEMLGDGIHSERARGISGRGQNVREPGDLDDVGSVAATRAFGVIGVNGPAGDGRDGIVYETRFVQCIGVDRYLDIEFVGHAQASVDGGGSGAPILV